MSEKLFISDEAIEKYGLAYFKGMSFIDFVNYVDNDFKELEDGLLLIGDDKQNVYLLANADDERYSNIEDLKSKIYVASRDKVFNMAEICRRSEVSYQSYKNWKSNGYKGLSDAKIERIIKEMKQAAE